VDGRVLLKEEEEEVEDDEQEERAEEEMEDDGADLSSTQEDNTQGQYIGKERELLEQDQHRIQTPINFIENQTAETIPSP